MFVVQLSEPSALDNKYATVQFISTVEVTYGGAHRTFQSTEIVQLPYPVIYNLYTATPQKVNFRHTNEENAFRGVYSII